MEFLESGHTLVLSNKSYRCALDCNQKCGLKEPQINAKKLERHFADYSMKFSIPEHEANLLSKKFLKEVFYRFIDDALEDDPQDEVIETTLAAAVQDVVQFGKNVNQDIRQLEESFIKRQKNDFSMFVIAGVAQAISSFSHEQKNQGQYLALLCKKIYISPKGKIEKIELENLGWYIINYLDRMTRWYLVGLKKNGEFIMNEPNEINEKEIFETAEYFKHITPTEMLSTYREDQFYKMITFMKGSLKMFSTTDPQKQSLMLLELFNVMNNNPMFQAMSPLVGLVRTKKEK